MARSFNIPVKDFSGGEVLSVDPALLQPFQLQQAVNVRFSVNGGFTNRPGYTELTLESFTGTGKIQGALATDYGMYIANNGNLYLSDYDINDFFEIFTGLDASADVEMFEYNGDVFVMNGVDRPHRIARTTTATALVTATSTSLDVSVGQGWRFGASGTIVVISDNVGDTITYTSKTNDTLTITDSTVSHDQTTGSTIVEVTELSSAPIGAFGAPFKNTWIMGGVKPSGTSENYTENIVWNSVGATGLNPEKFWDFASTGSGYTPVGGGGAVTAIQNTKDYLLIGKDNAVFYVSGYDSNSNLVLGLITDKYGVVGKRAITTFGRSTIVFNGKAIKLIGEQEGLNNTVPSMLPTFDDVFENYLNELPEDQSDAVFSFNPNSNLAKLWVTKADGTKEVIVIDGKKRSAVSSAEVIWSRDNNKQASAAVVYRKKTYFFSDTEPKIYEDEFGYTDNGLNIQTTVQSADFDVQEPRLSKYFKYLYIRGLLGDATKITVNIYFDGILAMTFIIDDSFVDENAVSEGIGSNMVGGTAIGGEPNFESATGKPFELEKLLLKRRDTGRMSVEYKINGQGQVFEIKSMQIIGTAGNKFDRKIRS